MNLCIIHFWLHWVFVAVCGPSLVAASGGHASLRCAGFSLQWPLPLWSIGSRCVGLSSCGTWAQQPWLTNCRAQAQQLWRTGLVAPRHMGSSPTRARTLVPCTGRRVPNHCATREARFLSFFKELSSLSHLPIWLAWEGLESALSFLPWIPLANSETDLQTHMN